MTDKQKRWWFANLESRKEKSLKARRPETDRTPEKAEQREQQVYEDLKWAQNLYNQVKGSEGWLKDTVTSILEKEKEKVAKIKAIKKRQFKNEQIKEGNVIPDSLFSRGGLKEVGDRSNASSIPPDLKFWMRILKGAPSSDPAPGNTLSDWMTGKEQSVPNLMPSHKTLDSSGIDWERLTTEYSQYLTRGDGRHPAASGVPHPDSRSSRPYLPARYLKNPLLRAPSERELELDKMRTARFGDLNIDSLWYLLNAPHRVEWKPSDIYWRNRMKVHPPYRYPGTALKRAEAPSDALQRPFPAPEMWIARGSQWAWNNREKIIKAILSIISRGRIKSGR
jgi:hypothetical protein